MKIPIGNLRQIVREVLAAPSGDVSGDEMQAFIDNPRNYRGIADDRKGGQALQLLQQRLRAQFGDRKLSGEAQGTLHGTWPGLMKAWRLGV